MQLAFQVHPHPILTPGPIRTHLHTNTPHTTHTYTTHKHTHTHTILHTHTHTHTHTQYYTHNITHTHTHINIFYNTIFPFTTITHRGQPLKPPHKNSQENPCDSLKQIYSLGRQRSRPSSSNGSVNVCMAHGPNLTPIKPMLHIRVPIWCIRLNFASVNNRLLPKTWWPAAMHTYNVRSTFPGIRLVPRKPGRMKSWK